MAGWVKKQKKLQNKNYHCISLHRRSLGTQMHPQQSHSSLDPHSVVTCRHLVWCNPQYSGSCDLQIWHFRTGTWNVRIVEEHYLYTQQWCRCLFQGVCHPLGSWISGVHQPNSENQIKLLTGTTFTSWLLPWEQQWLTFCQTPKGTTFMFVSLTWLCSRYLKCQDTQGK